MVTWQEVSPNTVALNGELSRHSVASLMPVAKRLKGYEQLNVELSKLSNIDSAGLAFLIELQEQASKLKLNLNFLGSTVALDKLIALYNAQSLLIPIES